MKEEFFVPSKDLNADREPNPTPVPLSPLEKLNLLLKKFGEDDDVEKESSAVMSRKIAGGYSKCVDLLLKKHTDNKVVLSKDLICIDSYDGSEYCCGNKGRTNLISFNPRLFSADTIDSQKRKTANGSFWYCNLVTNRCRRERKKIFPSFARILQTGKRVV